jgi:putative effector of murein hydrolase LrgA (UPF0299 family)
MNNQDIKKVFTAHKAEFPDEGFSERIIRQLPERKSILPQTIMAIFVMIGLALIFAIQGVTPMLEQINSLITSISYLEIPSPTAIITYIGALTMIGLIGYSVAQADAG